MYTLILVLLIIALLFIIYLEVCHETLEQSNQMDIECNLKKNSIGKRMAETYGGEQYSFVLFNARMVVIILLVIFIILTFFTSMNIIKHGSYDGKLALLEEENSNIDETMRVILITVKPNYVDNAKANDIALEGKYTDIVQTIDELKNTSGVKDQINRYNSNKKEIRKIKDKKNNISKYKRLIFLFWR